ncbi:fungal specific transcription factor domain-containing protein [Sarocladium implicatum]|nr:fungal specific transcription factor domain-containing protein [Sarocladium implicatum]
MGRLNRRIPNELRKRTAQSCDLCKARRCKCVPSGEGKTCVSCLDQGVECQYTAPRKQRFYGSLDDLSDRYRCLEAIVKGAFPDDATETTSDLVQLGHRLGCAMPELCTDTRVPVKVENLVRDPEAHFPTAATNTDTIKGESRRESDTKRTDGSSTDDQGSFDNEASSPAVFKDPSGNEHYIGPSGTLNFLHQLRQVFAATKGPSTGPGQQQPLQFPAFNTQTLESEAADPNGSSFDAARFSLSDWQEALSLLPSSAILEPLINAYFENTHEDFPLFHRSSFENQRRAMFSLATKPIQEARSDELAGPDWGWLGCLYMILVFGSIARPDAGVFDHTLLQQQYVAASRLLLPQLVSKCTLNNMRALILLALFLHNSNERNASWNLTGTAIRMAFAMGLHRKVQSPPSSATGEPDTKVLVLSTLYSVELFLSANLGRPSALNETDIEVFPLPIAPAYDGSGLDPQLISLTVGLNSILQRTRLMYAKRKPTYGGKSDPSGATRVDDIQDRLRHWRTDLRQYPRFDIPTLSMDGVNGSWLPIDGPKLDFHEFRESLASHPSLHIRARLMLHIQYHYIGIITTRHFLLHDIAAARLSPKGHADNISTLAQSCVFHAHQLSFVFILMDSFDLVNGRTAFDVFYGYWAGMLLNLMLLWPKSEKHLPEPGKPCPLNAVVQRVYGVVSRVDKCGTMQRLSSVMDHFVLWARSVDAESEDPSAISHHNGLRTNNGQNQMYQQQQQNTMVPGPAALDGVSMIADGQVPMAPQGPMSWTAIHNGAGQFGLGSPMGFAQLPQGSNEATAFLNSFVGPDDQAAMLGMGDGDLNHLGFGP